MSDFKHSPFSVPILLDRETYDYLVKILRVSQRLRISILQDILHLQSEQCFKFVVDWADKFGFVIDGDFIDFRSCDKNRFVNFLKSQISETAVRTNNSSTSEYEIPIQCPECKKYITTGSNVCMHCGHALIRDSVAEISSEGQCFFCGSTLRQNSTICPECGNNEKLEIQKSVLYGNQELYERLRQAEKENDFFKQAMICEKLELHFTTTRQYGEAIYYFNKALNIVKQLGPYNLPRLLLESIEKNLNQVMNIVEKKPNK